MAASLREFFLSACHLCISSHLLPFLCEMSSCGEMGEAIELRWVKYRVGGVNCVLMCVCLFRNWQGHPIYGCLFTLCVSMHIFISFSAFLVWDCAPGCILVSNWVDCYRSNQYLGLFFSASPLFLSIKLTLFQQGRNLQAPQRSTGDLEFLWQL